LEYREILLGFEHLHGAHSGANLSKVVLDMLQEHQITDRVLSVTTDNASNNKTLIEIVHEAFEGLQSSSDVAIIRVPCIAHVIQLSLKSLLGKMKAIPKNDTVEQTWSDDRVEALRATQREREIVYTLGKVRRPNFILIYNTNLFLRSEALRFILMQVLSARSHFTTYRQERQS
jgi:citrate lyase gamma subunit